jgi:hypothetical protein
MIDLHFLFLDNRHIHIYIYIGMVKIFMGVTSVFLWHYYLFWGMMDVDLLYGWYAYCKCGGTRGYFEN